MAKGELKTLYTPWGETLDRQHPLPEYPRPQLRRSSYKNLNGPWRCAFTDGSVPKTFEQEIIVPFSPESPLSGVNRTLRRGETLWYRRGFQLAEGFNRGRVLLHFGAVDQCCTVWVNGREAGRHAGGYLPFTCDITDCLYQVDNDIVVAVTDDTEQPVHAYGKQSSRRGGIWYTPQSGIWQTVWMESVPENYVENLRITPDFDRRRVRIAITAANAEGANIVVRAGGEVIAEEWADEKGEAECLIRDDWFRPWCPEDPFLYDVTVLLPGGDEVESYFGMRKFGTMLLEGRQVLSLNGRPIFMTGVLDQGYWSDGLYTAPSDEALIYDIQTMKDMGFNTLRKHIKIEPLRWYYHCDRLGMIVWQDMVSGGGRFIAPTMQILPFLGVHMKDTRGYRRFARESEAGRDQFVEDLYATVDLLYNCVSLAVWVPFNEGWGQFDSLQMTQILWELDPSRLVDHASGWHDQGGGDFKSRHVYYHPIRMKHDGSRVLAVTEFGGYSYPVADHTCSETKFGYRVYKTAAEFMKAWRALYEKEVIPHLYRQRLSAAIYTQLSDVEDEINGLVTYDRRVVKADVEQMRAINQKLQLFTE